MRRDKGIFIIRIFTAILFLVPGVYKLFSPGDFMGFLSALPEAVIPFVFYAVTAFEVIAGLCLLVGYKVRLVALPLAAILLGALVMVVLPEPTNTIYLINILFHVLGMAICVSFVWLGPGKWALGK